MKYFFILAIASLAFMPPQKKKRIVFFGDSITQAGVNPQGYITKMDSIIRHQGLADQYELIGAGISGNKVYDLFLRMDTSVISKKPDVVVIYIGINDVWHKRSTGTGTDPERYERFYRAIIKRLQDSGIRVIVCTPSVIGERNDNSNEQDGDLNLYSTIVRRMAKDLSLPVCDLRKAFTEYLLKNNPNNVDRGILTTDRVHLNSAGNLFVANEMWNTLKNLQ